MENLDLENNHRNTSRKIPLAIIFILLLAGIFLLIWYFFIYHRDSIDNFISKDVKLYSHWQIKKINEQNNDKINTLMNKIDNYLDLPVNLDEIRTNASELAIVNFQNQWLVIYCPIQNLQNQNNKYTYGKFVIKGIDDDNLFQQLIKTENSLSRDQDYKRIKKADTSLANLYISDISALPIEQVLFIDEELAKQDSFWKLSAHSNALIIKSKNLSYPIRCENNINIQDKISYKHYINNISTKNSRIFKHNPLNNADFCVDIIIDNTDNWHILAPKQQIKQLQHSISTYLAIKYPVEKQQVLPDNSISVHYLSDISHFAWDIGEKIYVCGNEQERYYLSSYDEYVSISKTDSPIKEVINSQFYIHLTNCMINDINPIIAIHNSDQFSFENIYIVNTQDDNVICIH